MTQDKQLVCDYCNTPLSDGAKFCPTCGKAIDTSNASVEQPSIAQNLRLLKPTKANFTYLREFLTSNFELSHTCYGVLFILTLLSAKRGFQLFIVLSLIAYVLGVLSKGQEIQANKKLISLFSQTYTQSGVALQSLQEESSKLVGKSSKLVGELAKPIGSDSAETNSSSNLTDESKKSVRTNLNTPITKGNSFGIASILLIVSCLLSLYGVLGADFFKMMNSSLYDTLGQLSQYSGYADSVNEYFSRESSNSSDIIQYIRYALVGIPILTLIFGIISSKGLQIIGVLLSFLELGFFILVGAYIGDKANNLLGGYSDSFSQALFDNQDKLIGLPAYALLIGSIGMVIFSLSRLVTSRNKGGIN